MNHSSSTTPENFEFAGVNFDFYFRILPRVLFAVLVLLLCSFGAEGARASNPLTEKGGVGAPQLFLVDDQQRYIPALVQDSRVHFDIAGMVANIELEQRFTNTTADWVEGVYAFPLPDDAAVQELEMQVADRIIRGRIREREAAAVEYQAAKAAGKKASLVEQQRPNLFSNRIANLAPGESITVRLRLVQPVRFEHGEFSLVFPTTITPRYLPGKSPDDPDSESAAEPLQANPYLGWAMPTDQVADGHAITPLQKPSVGSDSRPHNAIRITATLDVGMPLATVESPYHAITLTENAGSYVLALRDDKAEMNRDFRLVWRPVSSAAPQAAFFGDVGEGVAHGLLMVLPPTAWDELPAATPRELVLVVDTSGSMGGAPMAQARASLVEALRALRPFDTFNIISFNDRFQRLFEAPVPASDPYVARALAYVRGLEAGGGTEMLPALSAALADRDPEAANLPLRQVVFITDGAIGNEVALFHSIAAQVGRSRLFTVGIGAAPNAWFMRKAAEFGRGSYTFIADIDEVRDAMVALFERIAAPQVTQLKVTWPDGRAVDAYPQRLPDLYAGEPLMLAAEFAGGLPAGEVVIEGQVAGRPWRRTLQIVPEGQAPRPAVGTLWARQRIEHLLDEQVAGKPEEEVREAVLEVALAHSLLSPYTSFVAVEERISRPQAGAPLEAHAVPNSRPLGQAAQPYAYPVGSTDAPARLVLGLLLLFIALMVHVVRREEVDHVPAH